MGCGVESGFGVLLDGDGDDDDDFGVDDDCDDDAEKRI